MRGTATREDKVLGSLNPDIVFDATRRVLKSQDLRRDSRGIAGSFGTGNEGVGRVSHRASSSSSTPGDRVVRFGQLGRQREGAAGSRWNSPLAHVFDTPRPSGIVRVELAYTDRAETLEAAGLRERRCRRRTWRSCESCWEALKAARLGPPGSRSTIGRLRVSYLSAIFLEPGVRGPEGLPGTSTSRPSDSLRAVPR